MKITADTTNEQIQKATKEQLICALFTGSVAVLRESRRKMWSKTTAIEEAIAYRNLLQSRN